VFVLEQEDFTTSDKVFEAIRDLSILEPEGNAMRAMTFASWSRNWIDYIGHVVPAERYPQYGQAHCDMCRKTVPSSCIGLGEYDLCVACVDEFLSLGD
jgi:hypothetical protein